MQQPPAALRRPLADALRLLTDVGPVLDADVVVDLEGDAAGCALSLVPILARAGEPVALARLVLHVLAHPQRDERLPDEVQRAIALREVDPGDPPRLHPVVGPPPLDVHDAAP